MNKIRVDIKYEVKHRIIGVLGLKIPDMPKHR